MAKRPKREPFARLTWNRKEDRQTEPANLKPWWTFSPEGIDPDAEIMGRLILGDNLAVMQALLPEYAGKIDLIYADPPFLTGKAYKARIGQEEDSRKPEEWQTVQSYRDQWSDGGEYLDMLYPRLELMSNLLSPRGSLYLHLDWHASAYARVILDEIFGPDRLLNEIVWVYHGPSPIRSAFNRKHDTILIYTKSKDYTFNVDEVRIPYDPSTVKTFASSKRAGFGKKPDLARGKVPEDWWYFPVVARMHSERTGYPTQKPEALMQRIIQASSNPGDTVADFFNGSGTTPSVAHKLGRKWIACDPELTALQVCYRRMISIDEKVPFVVEHTQQAADLDILIPEVKISLEQEEVLISLEEVRLPSSRKTLPEEHLALWEIDLHFNGILFNSCYQEVRPWRKGSLNRSICINQSEITNSPIAIRVMDVRGRTGQISLDLDLS
jgi:DNA modification methylase